MLKLGETGISALRLGGTEIKKAYLGEAVVFDGSEPPVPTYTVSVTIDPDGGGTVTGAGTYPAGETVTVTAAPGDGYTFTGWQENGAIVSNDAAYSFALTGDRTLTAVFAVNSRLPAGYAEVEYIEADTATSGFVIKTGVRANTMLSAKFSVTQWPTTTAKKYLFYNIYSSDQRYLAVDKSNIYALWSSNASNMKTIAHTATVPFEINISVDGKRTYTSLDVNGTKGAAYGTQNVRSDLYLGGSSSTGSSSLIGMRIHYVKLSSETVTTSDYNAELIPCITPSGAAGLYDLRNKKSYLPNTGSFTAGPAV